MTGQGMRKKVFRRQNSFSKSLGRAGVKNFFVSMDLDVWVTCLLCEEKIRDLLAQSKMVAVPAFRLEDFEQHFEQYRVDHRYN